MSDDSYVVAMLFEAACFKSNAAQQEYTNALTLARPSYLLRPSLSLDGNQWCALYGENVQNGVVGFGISPEAAFVAFDKEWTRVASTEATEEEL